MRAVLFILLLAILAFLQVGCVSVGENNSSDLPWSAPASWEGKTLGVPL